MADPSAHQFTALSSSPRPSPLSRPHWPWSTYSHRQSSSSSSLPTVGSSSSSSWDPAVSTTSSSGTATWQPNSRNTASPAHTHTLSSQMQDESMRQWAFTAFEWVVRDVRKLRAFVEAQQPPAEGDASEKDTFEILKEAPILGDQKFKLEIARIPPDDVSGLNNMQAQTLSLYITSLMLDYPHADEISASMMAAIKCQDDRVGERGARPEWVWEFWQNDWIFRQESEVWECALPSLSSLLENPRIAETDSFVICIQIHSPTGPFYPQQPSVYYIPRDLLEGLEASLDNPHTGDVRFICLERHLDTHGPASPMTPHSPRSSSSSCQTSPHVRFTARKRILYAHSDILTRRSEYFATMLNSSFSENRVQTVGERRVFTIVVDEADFITVYWLLKWVYANWVLFQEEDDPRAAVDGTGTGWSAHWLGEERNSGEWDWRPVIKPVFVDDSNAGSRDDNASVVSGDSGESARRSKAPPVGAGKRLASRPAPPNPGLSHSPSITSGTSSSKVPTRPAPIVRPSGQTSASNTRRTMSTSASSKAPAIEAVPSSPSPSRTAAPLLVSRPQSASSYSHNIYHPLQTRQQWPHGNRMTTPTPDPHPHPTAEPIAASALSVYQIAHRYAMPGLASLALEHIMNTITPKSSFPLLLATSIWDELHMLVEDYVVERWDDVSASEDFDKCCQEVAAGEWGADGGKTLVTLFRRLRSPSTARYLRG